MTAGGNGIKGFWQGARLLSALALAGMLASAMAAPVSAQMFTDRPPPVPPASVPEPSGGALNLAPPSSPAPLTNLPAPLTQPSIAVPPPVADPPSPSTAGQAVLALTARYGKDLPVINNGLVWRVFSDRPDETGVFKMIREERGAPPNIVLPPGSYVVHVTLGLVSAGGPVPLKAETDRESFVLPAGGLRIEGRVGTSKIPQNQISFGIYKGSQFEVGERAALVPSVAAGDVVLLPEGTYYIVSNYGDTNSVAN